MASNQRDDEFRVDIARLLVDGAIDKHIFGRNSAVGGTIEDVWGRGGQYIWATVASTLDVVSTADEDTINGTGVRTVHLIGLDADMLEIEEHVDMDGQNVVTTELEFFRVNEVCAMTQGTYQTSTTTGGPGGNITIDRTSDSSPECGLFASLGGIAWDSNQSLIGRYSIPAGKTGYITRTYVNAHSLKVIDFVLWHRRDADTVVAPFSVKRSLMEFDGISMPFGQEHNPPIRIPEKTDLWWSVVKEGTGGDARATANFELILDDIVINGN